MSALRAAVEAAIDNVIPTDRIVQRHDVKRAADHALVAITASLRDDLPTLLRNAGYDVREGWEQDVRGAPIVWDWKRKPEGGKPCLVVVLPDEEDAS